MAHASAAPAWSPASPAGPAADVTTTAAFRHVQEELRYRTVDGPSFRDITDDVRAIVRCAGVACGQVSVFSQHTTAAVILQEHEPLLLADLRDRLTAFAPPGAYYRHNDFEIRTVNMHENEPENGHSHAQHLLLGTSETIPVLNGEPQLGEFQSIFLVELDEARDRRVLVTVLGVAGE